MKGFVAKLAKQMQPTVQYMLNKYSTYTILQRSIDKSALCLYLKQVWVKIIHKAKTPEQLSYGIFLTN